VREFGHGNIIRHRAMMPAAAKTDLFGTYPARRDGGQ
jgi:hypothetical protein